MYMGDMQENVLWCGAWLGSEILWLYQRSEIHNVNQTFRQRSRGRGPASAWRDRSSRCSWPCNTWKWGTDYDQVYERYARKCFVMWGMNRIRTTVIVAKIRNTLDSCVIYETQHYHSRERENQISQHVQTKCHLR